MEHDRGATTTGAGIQAYATFLADLSTVQVTDYAGNVERRWTEMLFYRTDLSSK